MDGTQGPAAPESGNDNDTSDTPTFDELAADPAIAALIEFEPVPRQLQKANGWTAAMQRMFIAWLAYYGSPGKAADELGKARSGIDKVYKAPDADSFRAAWDGAVALAERRLTERLATARSGAGAMTAPSINHRRKSAPPVGGGGQDEDDYDADEDSLQARVEEARDSISAKLLRCRRLYLQEISGSPGKRAAFEILTQYPIDWDKAERLQPQDDEPWRSPNMRNPDMLLSAENGWMGDMVHGPDKKRELREALNRHRAAQGKPAIRWEEDGRDNVTD